MDNNSLNTAAARLLMLCLVCPCVALAIEKVPVGGYVYSDSTPVCALVLINGQSQFSCDGTGRYDMQVPVDDNGMVTVQAFATGFAPSKAVVAPEQAFEYSIGMARGFGKQPAIAWTRAPSNTPDRLRFSGRVETTSAPLCALVLANGQNQFSCGERLGVFDLDVPLDQEGNITLQVFAAGFRPYRETFPADPDTDNDSVKDSIDMDDDNDGIPDADDDCPLVVSPGDCAGEMEITDTVFADGREWVQVTLFTNLSWSDVDGACRYYTCSGILNGYDVGGWHWATTTDIERLFNFYLGESLLEVSDRYGAYYENEGTIALFESRDAGKDGWRWTSIVQPTEGTPSTSFELRGIVKDRHAFEDWYGDIFLGLVYDSPYAAQYMYWASEPCESGCWREYFQFNFVDSMFYRDQGVGVWLYR